MVAEAGPPWPRTSYAWYVLGLLVVSFTFAIIDRSMISLLVTSIKTDLGVTDTQIGLLQGLAFAICYTTFGLLLGYATDRASRRTLLAVGLFVWSLATAASGFATSFEALFVSRIFVGLGEACVLPCSSSLIADYMPPKTRARAYGIFFLGGTFGALGGNLVGGYSAAIGRAVRTVAPPWIDVLADWQIAFVVAGVPGLFLSALVYASIREPVRRETVSRVAVPLRAVIGHVRLNLLSYGALLGAAALNMLCIYAHVAWTPSFLMRVHGLSQEQTGNLLALAAIAGASSSITVGWFMSRRIASGRQDAAVTAVLIHAVSCLVLGPLTYLAPGVGWMYTFYILKTLTSNWSMSAALMGLSQIAPNEFRGQLAAVHTFLTGLVSLSLGGYVVGALSDGVFTAPTGIRYSLTAVYVVAGGAAVLLVALGTASFRASVARARQWSAAEPA